MNSNDKLNEIEVNAVRLSVSSQESWNACFNLFTSAWFRKLRAKASHGINSDVYKLNENLLNLALARLEAIDQNRYYSEIHPFVNYFQIVHRHPVNPRHN